MGRKRDLDDQRVIGLGTALDPATPAAAVGGFQRKDFTASGTLYYDLNQTTGWLWSPTSPLPAWNLNEPFAVAATFQRKSLLDIANQGLFGHLSSGDGIYLSTTSANTYFSITLKDSSGETHKGFSINDLPINTWNCWAAFSDGTESVAGLDNYISSTTAADVDSSGTGSAGGAAGSRFLFGGGGAGNDFLMELAIWSNTSITTEQVGSWANGDAISVEPTHWYKFDTISSTVSDQGSDGTLDLVVGSDYSADYWETIA